MKYIGTKIICLVGPSGSGKTLMSKYMWTMYSIPFIVSYTTRPMREGEKDGVDHWFVDESVVRQAEKDNDVFAYTKFGGYEYFTRISDIGKHKVCTYVIDEDGLKYLLNKFPYSDLFPVYIYAPNEKRLEWGVDQKRIDRDENRPDMSDYYVEELVNDGERIDFFRQIDWFMEKYKFMG